MKTLLQIWSASWRIAVGGLLLVWAFHSIFVNEARELAERGELIDHGTNIVWSKKQPKDQQPPRLEQWRYGWKYGPPALWQTLRSVSPVALAVSFALMGGTLVVGMARWRMVLRVQGLELPFNRVAEISLVAHFFNSFLFGTAGGDVMKAYCAARETHHKKTEAVVTVFVDRVLGLWAMLVFATVMILPNYGLFLKSGLRTPAAFVVAMTAAASGFVFLAFRGGVSKKWSGARDWLRRLPKGEWLERSLDSCRKFGQERGFVRRVFALSTLVNLLCVLQFYVLAHGLPKADVPFLALCLVVPMIICISALPLAPGGVGVRENLFVQLLAAQTIGVAATPALSLSLLAFAGSLAWGLIGGVVYLMFKHKHHLTEGEEVES